MKRASLRVVLVRPRDPNNIGAAARAMVNFGLRDLRVVAPYPSVWREAKSAVGAQRLLRAATEAATIEEAVAGCKTVWATSSMNARRPESEVLDLPSIRWPAGPLAILFGQEKTGLTAEDLAYASAVIRIPTSDAQPSMNLASAVAVIGYEWTRASLGAAGGRTSEGAGTATAAMKSRVWDALGALGREIAWPAGERTRRLKAAVYRSNLSEAEAGMALEFLRRIRRARAWRCGQPPDVSAD